MDYSKEVSEKFPDLKQNGEIKSETPNKRKEFTEADREQLIQESIAELNDIEELITAKGFHPENLISIYEVLRQEITNRIDKLKPVGEKAAAPVSVAPAAEVKKEEPAAEDDPTKYFFDFEKSALLKCFFLGAGRTLKIKGRDVETWKMQEMSDEKNEWLLPKWKSFEIEQGNFFGFPKETPGKFIYQITFKGKDPDKNIYLFEILKKLPPTNGKS